MIPREPSGAGTNLRILKCPHMICLHSHYKDKVLNRLTLLLLVRKYILQPKTTFLKM